MERFFRFLLLQFFFKGDSMIRPSWKGFDLCNVEKFRVSKAGDYGGGNPVESGPIAV
jgi:hypothetical protein